MATIDIKKTNELVDNIEGQGVVKTLNSNFGELMSMGRGLEKNVCKMLRDYLISGFGLQYFTKLNSLAKNKFVDSMIDEHERFCRWIDNDVMEGFSEVCETDIFDSPRTLSALSDTILALNSSINLIDEEDIVEEMEYIFDVPYRLSEMIRESARIPKFYSRSLIRQEQDWSERTAVKVSDKSFSISYKWTSENE